MHRPTPTRNTGAAYMESRGWDGGGSGGGGGGGGGSSISFHGKRTSKRLAIALISCLCFLLLAAIVIIILFATGVLSSPNEIDSSTPVPFPTAGPIIGPPPAPITMAPAPPPIVQPRPQGNHTYACSFVIERQANAAYENKSSNNFQSAFRMVRTALLNVIYQSTLQPLGVTVTLDDLRNRGDDLEVVFRLTLPASSSVDPTTVANVLRADRIKLQQQIGNVSIDPASIIVNRTS